MGALLAVARVSKLYGLDGEVTVNLYDNFPKGVNNKEPMYVVIDTLSVPLFIDSFERRGKRKAQIRFADIDSEHRAEEMIGLELSLVTKEGGRGRKRDDDDFTFEDLVGYEAVISEDGEQTQVSITGVVVGFIDSEMNPLIEVEVEGKEVLIPAVDEFIVSIDVAKQRVEFSLPEGLMGLYL